jgi:hypothetical protein
MARPSIMEAIERKRPRNNTSAAPESQPQGPPPLTASASREGKVNISGYFPMEVKSSLRLVQAKRGGKVQDLLAEALNLLFAKYNVPETAPVEKAE